MSEDIFGWDNLAVRVGKAEEYMTNAEAREAANHANHATMHRTELPNKNLSGSKCQ